MRKRTLTGKFLILALPPMILSAAFYLLVISWFEIQTVLESEQQVTDAMAGRYADILARPIWNLEEETSAEILDSLIAREDTTCLQLEDVIGLEGSTARGNCEELSDSSIIARAPIIFSQGRIKETIGTLMLVRKLESGVTHILQLIAPQIVLTLILLSVMIVLAFYGFRKTVTAPLGEVQRSLRSYEESGSRQPVNWSSSDELGQFVDAYNGALERQAASESALRKQLDLTRTLLKTVPNPIVFLSTELVFQGCNDSFSIMFGVEEENAVGKPINEVIRDNPWKLLPENLETVFPSSMGPTSVYSTETTVHDRQDKLHTVIFSTGVLRDPDGNVTSLVSLMQDITQRKRSEIELENAKEAAEKALSELRIAQGNLIQSEKMASLGSLVAGISHEINTPIGSCITVASSIAERAHHFQDVVESGKIRKSDLSHFVDTIAEASDILNKSLASAAELIQNFKQVAVDQTTSKRRRFDLERVVTEVASTLQPAVKKTPHLLELDIHQNIPMDSYPGPLGQVITNIVNNALIHAFERTDSGVIRISSDLKDDDKVTLIVSDTGSGIPKAHIKRIFDPFFTTKMGSGGTGLGLNVTYNIVTNLLGGTIQVTSVENEGSTFTITLPRVAPDTREEAKEATFVI